MAKALSITFDWRELDQESGFGRSSYRSRQRWRPLICWSAMLRANVCNPRPESIRAAAQHECATLVSTFTCVPSHVAIGDFRGAGSALARGCEPAWTAGRGDAVGSARDQLLRAVGGGAPLRDCPARGEPQRMRDLSALLGDLPVERALDLVRAFSSYFPCEDLDTHFSQRGSARCRASLRDTGDKRQICAPLQIWMQIWTPSFSRTMRVLEKLVSLPENLRNWTVWSRFLTDAFGCRDLVHHVLRRPCDRKLADFAINA